MILNNEYSRIEAIEALKDHQARQKPHTQDTSVYVNEDFYDVTTIFRQQRIRFPKNVIVMIGDGMGPAQVAGGMLANRGRLYMHQAEHTGFSMTHNALGQITDSAAGATAIATGIKTYNKAIAVDATGKPRATLMMEAQHKGLATGVVVCCEVTDATPASFMVNHPDRNELEAIAAKMVASPLTFLYGGGRKYFDRRADGCNLLHVWQDKGYQVITDPRALAGVQEGKVAALLSQDGPLAAKERTERYLQEGVNKALQVLRRNEQGFFLMIEGSQIDDAGHYNDVALSVEEVLDFDKMVGKVLSFAAQDEETLVVITADHETGGYAVIDQDIDRGMVQGRFSSTDHTGVAVPVFAFGPGSELFSGFYQNHDIYYRIRRAMGWQ